MLNVTVVRPIDPNDKIGSSGVGPNRVVAAQDEIEYMVRFENAAGASAPVQELVVVDYLDANLDWTTVEFEEVAYGDRLLAPPAHAQSFNLRDVPPPDSPSITGSDTTNLAVNVSGMFNPQMGRVEWRLTCVDTNTGWWPMDALSGLLPPEDGTGRGQGHVKFRVKPKADTPFGTGITNIATIVFENNEPIDTSPVWNIIGDVPSLAATVAYAPGQIMAGTPFTYMVMLTNSGSGGITNVALTNTLSGGAVILSGAADLGSVVLANGILSWNIGLITNGATATLTVSAVATAEGVIANQVEFTGGSGLAILSTPSDFTVSSPTRPILGIRQVGGGIELFWPTSASGFRLEAAATLSPTSSWLAVTNVPVPYGQEYRVDLGAPRASEFYRLVKP